MDLYFKNVSADGAWENHINWFTDIACTTSAGLSAGPWQSDDATKACNLHRGTDSIAAEDNIYINSNVGNGFEITGECTIGYIGSGGATGSLTNNSNIYGGTFSGDNFINNNNGYIYGGAFSGYGFNNNSGTIYGGTFSGEYFTNNGYIYGGAFSGEYFTNSSTIYGGTFSGEYFTNYGNIYGGTFSGDNFSNNYGTIYGGTFSGYGFNTNNSNIYGGTFSGYGFNNNSGTIYGGTFSGDNFSNNYGTIYGGNWLESGKLNVSSYDYIIGETITSITGSVANPYEYSSGVGFATISAPPSDILGTGLL